MWTLQFEAKHSEFKAKKLYNFRNVPKTIAYRSQLLLCYEMLGSNGEFYKNFFYAGEIVDSSCSVKFTQVFPHLTNMFKHYVMPTCGYGSNTTINDVKVAIASSFVLIGCKYKPGIFLTLKTENYNIKLGKITKLFELEGFKFTIYKEYQTVGYGRMGQCI